MTTLASDASADVRLFLGLSRAEGTAFDFREKVGVSLTKLVLETRADVVLRSSGPLEVCGVRSGCGGVSTTAG